ncbi:MAG: PfkB family carbohydrate kinase, partial [Acetobacteraceae bacterium]
AEAWSDGAMVRMPAPSIVAVDTTAAGDCLAGVLAAALDRGAPLPDALRRAVAAASVCCTRAGSQGSLPGAAETDAALRMIA